MSRVKVSPVEWRDEGPRTPYSPNVRLGGALVQSRPAIPSPVLPPQRTQQADEARRDFNKRASASRHDPELGEVRRCTNCHEDWPLDEEFWYFGNRGDGVELTSSKCKACYNLVYKEARRRATKASRERAA